jgi:ATP-dependent Clp protease protease subunit
MSNIDKNEFRKYAVKHHRINSIYVDKFISGVERANMTPSGVFAPPTGYTTPNVIEERQLNGSVIDVFSRLMMDRIIFLGDAIYEPIANIIQAQLLFLQSADSKRDIQIYINSPGGSVYAGLGIYDTMQFISNDVATICTGMAASMAAVLLCTGTAGKRAALPHSRVMIHQPSGGAQGQQSDIEITYHEITKLKNELYQIIADHSGASFEKVWDASDRDHWMIAEEAKEFGMIDEILRSSKAKK